MQQYDDSGGELWHVEATSAVDNAEPNSAAFLLVPKIYLWSLHLIQLLMAKPGCFWSNKYIGSDM